MNPQNWLASPTVLETKLCQLIQWYDSCEKAISQAKSGNGNIFLARQLKRIFLDTVDLNDINEYLSFYRPIQLNANKLIRIEKETLEYVADDDDDNNKLERVH